MSNRCGSPMRVSERGMANRVAKYRTEKGTDPQAKISFASAGLTQTEMGLPAEIHNQ